MKIIVSSRMAVSGVLLEIQKSKLDNKVVVISIIDPKSDPVSLPILEADVLRLNFHDLDRTYPISCPAIVLFDVTMAEKIKLFIEQKIWGQFDGLIAVCHCEAGISRSSGVAAALAKHFNNDDSKFFKYPYLPNRLVYRTLLNLLNGADNPVPNVYFGKAVSLFD